MSNQVLQWQKQHQCDLKMLAAKEEQLRAFQEEMCALKENLLADEKEVGAPRLPITSSPENISFICRMSNKLLLFSPEYLNTRIFHMFPLMTLKFYT